MPMAKHIRGPAYVVGDDVDTDQIIPAQYLMYNPSIPDERRLFGRFCMSSVPPAAAGLPDGHHPFVDRTDPANCTSTYRLIIGGRNFGCGSSREHAPLAIAEAGVYAVVAEFYARIFFRNAVNGGFLVPFETDQRLCEQIRTGDDCELDCTTGLLINHSQNSRFQLKGLGDAAPIIEAGGVFAYARQTGMLSH